MIASGMEVLFVVLAGVAILLAAATALLVWRTAPTRRLNRRLATVLVLEAFFGLFFILAVSNESGIWFLGELGWEGSIVTVILLPWAYLRFLGWAVDTPLVTPLRGPLVDKILAVAPATGIVVGLVVPLAIGQEPFVYIAYPMMILVLAVPIFALVASFHAWRRAGLGTPERTRARFFLAAFAVRDLSLILMWLGAVGAQIAYGNWEARVDPAPPPPVWVQTFHGASFGFLILGILAYIPLLAYGVLKTQLFDIDIKIKVGIKATTLTAFFVVAFFAAEELGQALISQRAGPYVGLAGAGALALAFVPLRRVAERVANRTMPHVDTSEAYIAARRRNVYRAAVEGAFEDGQVTPKERAILTHLAAELLLEPGEMAEIEAEVRERRVPHVHPHDIDASSEAS